jgi:2-polyprenyl-6-hydroxyphenyl methylase/3-demethylubiquinone-9 3-methyltransferase
MTAELRFKFGENWSKFLRTADDRSIFHAERSLTSLLGLERLEGMTFLDVGSGSGLSSLAARRLGAVVTSFDYDPAAVECASALRGKYFPADESWIISQGSALDANFLASLGKFDIVYSWGVLHHTGRMWQALDDVSSCVAAGGLLVIAIYNDQGRASRAWTLVKRAYNRLHPALRFPIVWSAAAWLWGPAMLRDVFTLHPFATWRNYHRTRGMSPWRDVIDWVGGYPFEVAKADEVFDFYAVRGFRLMKLVTCGGGHGCNEFAFLRESSKP